jgi:membrane associated rhomboid family serine protease
VRFASSSLSRNVDGARGVIAIRGREIRVPSIREAPPRRAEFRYRRFTLVLGLVLFGGGGAFLAAGSWNERLWHGHGQALDLAVLENDAAAALGLAIAAFLLLTLFARPRLIVAFDGLRRSGFLRRQRVPWDRLGRFAVIDELGGRRRRLEAVCLAPRGSAAKPSRFVIPDVYDQPPETMLATIEAIRDAHGIEPAARAPAPPVHEPLGLQGLAVPWVTLALALAMFLVFILELALRDGHFRGVVSRPVLVAAGGLTRAGVLGRAQWWRLLTATYLHASFAHIMGNTAVLLLIGWRLERLIGHAWFAAAFVLSSVAGWVVSLAVLPPGIVAVGASGGIMGLLACALVASFRLPSGDLERRRLQVWSLRIAVPALLPLQGMQGGLVTDYAAHVGGVVAGYALGMVLLGIWRHQAAESELGWQELREALRGHTSTALPPARGLAVVIALAGFGTTALAAFGVLRGFMG